MEPDSLIDKSKPWGEVTFIHKDGTQHKFWSCVNSLTGSRLTAFDWHPPSINEPLARVKKIFKAIHLKARVIKTEGPLAQPPNGKRTRQRNPDHSQQER